MTALPQATHHYETRPEKDIFYIINSILSI